ncbi:MAG: hypothetical protein MR428_01375 [Mesosutterella sp.]|nr:hypothetical protein [Mesosutterella sp.]
MSQAARAWDCGPVRPSERPPQHGERKRHRGFVLRCLLYSGAPRAHPKSFGRLRDKLKDIFYCARGTSLRAAIARLNPVLRGWRQ